MKKLLLALVLIIGLIFLFNNNLSDSGTEAPAEEVLEVDSTEAPAEEVDSTAAPAE